jgi:hypothetical protein
MAALGTDEKGDKLSLFSEDYLILVLVFAGLVGLAMMMIEWRVPAQPRETFMRALGLPALVMGALNTTLDARKLSELAETKERLSTALARQADIPIIAPTPIPGASGLLPEPLGPWLGPFEARPAYAQARRPVEQKPAFDPGIRIREPQYLITIDRAATEAEAREKANRLRARIPEIDVVRGRDGYLVVTSPQARPRAEAILEAIRLKERHGLRPSLWEVREPAR